MGREVRYFTPAVAVTLDALLPADTMYRSLDRGLELYFVRDLFQALVALADDQVWIQGPFHTPAHHSV
jgi:hypothetical protein